MTTAAANETYQVTIHGRLEGQECLNILYFNTPNGSNSVENNLIAPLLSCFVTHIVPVLGSLYSFERISAKRVTPDLGPELQGLPDGDDVVQGQAESDTLPSFASCRIRIRSARGGKSGLGRMSIGGVPEEACVGSAIQPGAAFWTGVVAFVACVVTAFIITDFPANNKFYLGVMSRKIGGNKPPFTLNGFSFATSLQPINTLGTMNSRKVGHGS